MSDSTITCWGCGASVSAEEGATHAYLGAAAGCYALFTEVLSRGYSDFRYARSDNFVTDTYAVTHVGHPEPRTIQSAAVHLMALYVQIELGKSNQYALKLMQVATQHTYHWLTAPDNFGAISIVDIHAAPDPDTHHQLVDQWARQVWQAWQPHHAQVAAWVAALSI